MLPQTLQSAKKGFVALSIYQKHRKSSRSINYIGEQVLLQQTLIFKGVKITLIF